MHIPTFLHRAPVGYALLSTCCGGQIDPSSLEPPGRPPLPSPSSQPTTTTTPKTFAIRKVWSGESVPLSDPQEERTPTPPWESIGFNLDGKSTTQHSTDVCTLVAPNCKP